MAAATIKRLYLPQELNPYVTTGAWTEVVAANLASFNHTAAAESTVLTFAIPRTALKSFGDWEGGSSIQKISVLYTIGTAALTGAPTVALDKQTVDATTRAVSRAAIPQTLAFTGTDTVGTTSPGVYAAEVTITTPGPTAQTDQVQLEITFPCAATSVVKVLGLEVLFQ